MFSFTGNGSVSGIRGRIGQMFSNITVGSGQTVTIKGGKVTVNGVEVTGSGGNVTTELKLVAVVDGEKTEDVFVCPQDARFSVRVANGCNSVSTTSGDVQVEGQCNAVNCTSGDVIVSASVGSVNTTSGDVDVSGNVASANTVSGKINARSLGKTEVEMDIPVHPNINLSHGDLLLANVQYIAHQTNCTTRGASGLAKAMFEKFPDSNTYITGENKNMMGKISVHGKVINMYAQEVVDTKPSRERRSQRFKWFQQCLDAIGNMEGVKSIAFPFKIGCGLAGGNWRLYYAAICDFATKNEDIDVTIVKMIDKKPGQTKRRRSSGSEVVPIAKRARPLSSTTR